MKKLLTLAVSGKMAYSANGASWTQITVGVTGEDEWQGVAFGMFSE